LTQPPDQTDSDTRDVVTDDDGGHGVIPFPPSVVRGSTPGWNDDPAGVESAEPESAEYLPVVEAVGGDDVEDPAEPVATPATADPPVAGKRIALVGRFGSMNHREAGNVLRSYHAVVVDLPRSPVRADAAAAPLEVDWVVIGADQPPLSQTDLLSEDIIQAAARGDLEVISETELWQRVGLVESERSIRRYYTPAMLAELSGVSVRVVRRWHRRGLITPVTTLHKLPYFDYAEVATAKRLAGWITAGASTEAIERRLIQLIEVLPNIRRPLDQLSILVEGKQILLRQGDGLVEPGGQMRFDFDAMEPAASGVDGTSTADDQRPAQRAASAVGGPSVIAFHRPGQPPMWNAAPPGESDPLLQQAYQAEDNDDLQSAVDLYHTILARDGASAEISFQIGELLYRMNQPVAARERFYAAIEMDPDFVEARASLGGVLAELGQHELAIAALRGALSMHPDYADVHYTLAKTLDEIERPQQAIEHWQTFLELAPDSAWGDEARDRLGLK